MCGNETMGRNTYRKKASITGGYLVNNLPSQRSLIGFVQLPVFDRVLMEMISLPLSLISLLSLMCPEMLFGLKQRTLISVEQIQPHGQQVTLTLTLCVGRT